MNEYPEGVAFYMSVIFEWQPPSYSSGLGTGPFSGSLAICRSWRASRIMSEQGDNMHTLMERGLEELRAIRWTTDANGPIPEDAIPTGIFVSPFELPSPARSVEIPPGYMSQQEHGATVEGVLRNAAEAIREYGERRPDFSPEVQDAIRVCARLAENYLDSP